MVHAVPRWAPLEADMLPFTMRVTAPTGTLAAAPIGVPSNTVGRVQTIGINGVPVSIPPTPSTPADALVLHPELPPLTDFTTAAFAHLDKVERPTSEYVQVMQYLDSLVVESVYEVRNETLDMQYGIVISGSNIICSQKMLHGTSVASIDAIVREGFKVGGVEVTQKHGARNGRGIYMTAHAYTAANYSHRQKSQYIVLAETVVTPACFTLGGRPTGFGGRPLVAMDSVEGAANAAMWEYYKVVQPDKTLMRPLYVVKFKDEAVQGQRQRFSGTKPAPSLDH